MASFFVGKRESGKGKSMSLEENKRLAREAIKIWTTGELDAADALYAPTTSITSITTPMIPAICTECRQ